MRAPLLIRLLVAPLVALVVAAGVWVTGAVITDDFRASAALTAVWFGLAGLVCAVVAYRVRGLRIPIAAGYLLTAVGIGAFLAWSTLHDRVVDEDVTVGVPAAEARMQPTEPARRQPIELAAGTFRSGEHETTGRAALVRPPDGRLIVTLTGFRTSAGPDLRVRIVPGSAERGDARGNLDLGALKGNIGDQQYELDRRRFDRDATVVIWCRAFSATFGTARLRAS